MKFKVCAFIAGVFIIVFTFIQWNPAKWIIFAFGIALVLHSFMNRDMAGGCCTTKTPVAKPVPAKKKK